MGPWIETDVDLDALETVVRVNDRETIRFRTNDMLFSVRTFLEPHVSLPSPCIPATSCGWAPRGSRRPCNPGDRVDIEITGIGMLSNPVAAEG